MELSTYRRRLVFPAIAVLTAGLLVGCSIIPQEMRDTSASSTAAAGDPTSSPEDPSDDPDETSSPPARGGFAPGDTYVGEGFSLVIPEGWGSRAEPPLDDPDDVDVLLIPVADPAGGVLNVYTRDMGDLSMDEILADGRSSLDVRGVTDIEEIPARKVDGRDAAGLKGTFGPSDMTDGEAGTMFEIYVKNGSTVHTVYLLTWDPDLAPEAEQAAHFLLDSMKFD